MARKKKRPSPEEREQLESSYRRTVKLLEERIAYHEARLAEERRPRAAQA